MSQWLISSHTNVYTLFLSCEYYSSVNHFVLHLLFLLLFLLLYLFSFQLLDLAARRSAGSNRGPNAAVEHNALHNDGVLQYTSSTLFFLFPSMLFYSSPRIPLISINIVISSTTF